MIFNKLIVFLLFVFLIHFKLSAQDNSDKNQNWFNSFFSPIPKPKKDFNISSVTNKWELRPVVSLPALKLTESTRSDAEIDALLLTSTGGGISYQHLNYDVKSEKWSSDFSWSPVTILLSGNLTAENPIDISIATSLGFFNNIIMIGGGYDLGSVGERSRFFGVISIGINFNN